jgi:TonB family protein
MDTHTVANLIAWSLQIALLTVAGGVLLRTLKISAPVIRHACWRALLVLCLALPFLQPWKTAPAALTLPGIQLEPSAPISDATSQHKSNPIPPRSDLLSRAGRGTWLPALGFLIAAGAVVRLVWLAGALLRLRRLRRAGVPAASDGDYEELGSLVQAGADVRYVGSLGQPVTFGVLRPVVLLPESFRSMPRRIQRAVLAHELWHVRRRDWAWVVIEELLRAAFWFNPAMSWLISRVQASREEVVDELTVLVTNARRSYLEALLTFADEPTLFPAAPFARRNPHLFQRMTLISSEAVMSSRRIVATSATLMLLVLLTAAYGASAFPLEAAAAAIDRAVVNDMPPSPGISRATGGIALRSSDTVTVQSQAPRDRRPGDPGPETAREVELKKKIESDPSSGTALYFDLAKLQESRGAVAEVENTYLALRQAQPTNPAAMTALASFYMRWGKFDKGVEILQDYAAQDPSDAQRHQVVATYYWEKAFKDQRLTTAERQNYLQAGIAATDRALAANPDYLEALTYKNILLRMQANLETDGARQQALIAEADALRSRALELNKARQGQPGGVAAVPDGMPLPPPPPPPPPPPDSVDGQAPVRVGGNIKPPVKTRDVRPLYPEVAQSAKVTGVVILEATINTTGQVSFARVLRGQPMLDQAALDAVYQWEFMPTLLNGAPVPVIMTVTVSFMLQE